MEENNKNNEPLNKDFKVPKIRFQNYDSYWIKNRLSKISKCYKGGNLSKEDVSNIGTIPCILYGELYTHYLNKIENVLLKTDYKKNLIQSKKGDIIMPLSGETPLDISNSAVIPFDGVALGGDLIAIRTALNPLFLSYQISGKRKAQIAKIAQGKTIVHSNPKYLMNLWIFYPTLDEQNKIADMLVCLSKKIYLINVKIETLKKYKEGLIQKGLELLKSNLAEYVLFSEIYKQYKIRNKFNLNQFTVGKEGLKLLNETNYDLSNHIVFEPFSLLIGIGIEEIAVSKNETGSVSPVYNVYKIINLENFAYTKYFLKPLLWRKKAFITRKSTRREYEVDINSMVNIKLPISHNKKFVLICESIRQIEQKISIYDMRSDLLKKGKTHLLDSLFI